MFLVGLRSHVNGIVAWGGFLALFGIFEANSYNRLTGEGTAAHLAFGQQMAVVGQATSILISSPEHLETLSGYLAWFLLGYIPIFYSIWALVAGTGALRGEEERGLVETWLGAGVTRPRLVMARMVAFAGALLLASAMVALATVAAANLAGEHDIALGGILLQALTDSGPCLVIFALGLVASSLFPTRRDALGATSVTFIVLLLLNGFSRHVEWIRPYRWISPFAYSDRSDPMVPGGHVDVMATLALLVVAVILATLATLLLIRRDLGSGLLGGAGAAGGPVVEPDRNPLLGVPALVAIWDQRVGLMVWTLGLFSYGLIEMSVVRPFVDFFKSNAASSITSEAFGVREVDPVAGFVGGTVYLPILVFLASYAITQVSRWASEDSEGRLEMILSTGLPRWRVVVDRFLALFAASCVILAGAHLGLLTGAQIYGLGVSGPKMLVATTLILPMVLTFGAIGSALAAFRPRLAMFALAGLVLVSYMFPFVVPVVFAPKPAPDWVLNLSFFHLYGIPLTRGVNWSGLWILLAIAAGGLALTLRSMARREVGS